MDNKSKLTFQENGAPYSLQFDDIYFDTDEGFLQSEAVFVKGNHIFERLKKLPTHFTIAETGFGTGLNFLLTLACFQELSAEVGLENCPQLHFVSVEKYPMTKAQLSKSLMAFPELSGLTELFVAQYPRQVEHDFELMFFGNKIKLTVLIGDALTRFSELQQEEFIDAWYLDGFSPTKNPDMWQLPVYQQLARLSKPQATLSTFTVAGKVRRELAQAGFRIEKRRAPIKKKEILFGQLQQHKLINHGYKLRPTPNKPQHIAVVGGGIASACTAYALTQKGIKVTLYCKDDNIAQGASSNAIGALYPLFHQIKDDISVFYQQAFNFAKSHYRDLFDQGYQFEHDWCGLLELSFDDKLLKRQQAFERKSPWPETLIQALTAEQASTKAGVPLDHGGLFIPEAGWVSPRSLVNAVIKATKETGRLKVKTQTHIKEIKQLGDLSWSLITTSKAFNADAVVLCTGAEGLSDKFASQLPLYPVRGQVSSMNANEHSKQLRTVICHKGYLTPENHGIHCIGATFEKNAVDHIATKEDDEYNLAMLEQSMPGFAGWTENDINSSKARVRCMTPDHMPVVGAMPDIDEHVACYPHLRKDKNWKYQTPAPYLDNLYLLTGLGARGLVTAPLLASILAAELSKTPYPVDDEMLFNLSPNRFVVRELVKRIR